MINMFLVSDKVISFPNSQSQKQQYVQNKTSLLVGTTKKSQVRTPRDYGYCTDGPDLHHSRVLHLNK